VRLFSSSDRNSGKMFHSGAVDGKTLFYSPLEIFEYYTRESSPNGKYLGLSKPKHLHVPMEGIKLLPAGTPPSALTNNDALCYDVKLILLNAPHVIEKKTVYANGLLSVIC